MKIIKFIYELIISDEWPLVMFGYCYLIIISIVVLMFFSLAGKI